MHQRLLCLIGRHSDHSPSLNPKTATLYVVCHHCGRKSAGTSLRNELPPVARRVGRHD